MSDELKTIKFQLMLSPSEAEAIDEWGFENRIRTRAEAIRRLCRIGIHQETDLKRVISLIAIAGEWLEKGRVWANEENETVADKENENQPAAASVQANFIASMTLLAAFNAASKIKESSDALRSYADIEEAFKKALEKSERAADTEDFLAEFIDDWKSRFPVEDPKLK